jgi:hypothetical protein
VNWLAVAGLVACGAVVVLALIVLAIDRWPGGK